MLCKYFQGIILAVMRVINKNCGHERQLDKSMRFISSGK